MSENNYGALMMKSTLSASVDIDSVFLPGIYQIDAGNETCPDPMGGILTVHAGSPRHRTFSSDAVIFGTSTFNSEIGIWSSWSIPVSHPELASTESGLGGGMVGTTVNDMTVQQYIDCVSHISILEYIKPDKWKYLNNPATAESNIGDLHDIIMKAQKDAAISGKPLVFCGPKATYLEGVTSSQNFFFPTSPVEWVEGCAILATGHGKCRLVPVAATPANTFIFTIPPAKGKPRIVIDGLGFTATNYRDKNVGGFTFKRGCYTSDIRNIFIQDCYYGGFVIKPENATGQTAAEDIVNLNIDNL
ncbi:MAG: hypothetical protein E6054_06705, partial [Klebsiella michiganensis]|nr:hypothetical protein [Klebsiella michiganensis]